MECRLDMSSPLFYHDIYGSMISGVFGQAR